ncbi:hypothetical protein [Kitasatospora sp. MBT66]|uniref:hypothetical protein n=1 Tax=Kitasatospora sp. MBT66 TaxID=1444769 RepID=UPI000689E631|nr:hypothetical protein [Kitasatospora sp. MBT66]
MCAAFDHRLVQTGVIGHASSEIPIILPMEAHELERWRKLHPSCTYWCGTKLGGCGRQLADRLYRDKVCHFAHHPNHDGSPFVCHRTANGEDSADHLFIKQGVERWLRESRLSGSATLRNLGTGPGDAVDVHIPKTRQRFRFQLSGLDYRAWRRADMELADDADGIDWIFNQDGPITREMLGRFGYTLRVRCETEGAVRRIYVGAERPHQAAIDWTPFEDCTLTPTGLITKTPEGPLSVGAIARPRPRPASFALQGGAVFALDTAASAPADSPLADVGRYVVAADVRPPDSRIIRALISIPDGVPHPSADHVYRFTGTPRIALTEPDGTGDPQWLIQAGTFERLNAREAHRTGLWTPPPSPPPVSPSPAPRSVATPAKKVAPTLPAQSAPRKEPVKDGSPQEPRTAHRQAVVPSAEKRPPVTPGRLPEQAMAAVSSLKLALERAVGHGATVTWHELAEATDLELSSLPISVRRDLLIEVDRRSGRLLSAVVRTSTGTRLPYLADIASAVGLEVPPPTGGARPTVRLSEGPTPPTSRPRDSGASVEQVQRLVTAALGYRRTTPGKPGRHLAKVIASAQRWLAGVQGQRGAAVRLRALNNRGISQAQLHTTALTRAIAAAQERPAGTGSEPHSDELLFPAAPVETPAIIAPGFQQSPKEPANAGTLLAQGHVGLSRQGQTDGVSDVRGESQKRSPEAHNAQLAPLPRREATPTSSPEAGQPADSESLACLETVLDLLDVQDGTPAFLDLYRALEEADRIAHRIGEASIPAPLRERLYDWRAVFRATPPTDGSATSRGPGASQSPPDASVSRCTTADSPGVHHSEARALFDDLAMQFRAAQDAGDLGETKRIRKTMGAVYAQRLSPEDREAVTPMMREFKQWALDQRPTDPALRRIRALLQDLGQRKATATVADIRSVLQEADRLRHRLAAPLPEPECKLLDRWRNRMKHRRE